MNKEIVFYCGAHKTASSMIRKFLRNKRQLLEKSLNTTTIDRSEIMTSQFFEPIKKMSAGIEVDIELKKSGKDKLNALVESSGNYEKYILHNEDFFNAIFFDGYVNIIEYLASSSVDHKSKFVLYIREQSSYIESWYMQQIHTGRSVSFDDYFTKVKSKNLDWLDIVEQASKIFGNENILIKPYETIYQEGSKKYLSDFLDETCGVIDIGDYDVESQNRSFSNIAMEMALQFYPKISVEERKILRSFLQKNFSTRTHSRPMLLNEMQREEIKLHYSERNKLLFESYLIKYDGKDLGYY